jgi:uncharacterized protein
MRWVNRRQSANVEDLRGMGGGKIVGGGLGTIILALAVYFLGGDPRVVLDNAPTTTISRPAPQGAQNDAAKQFVATVLADTEDVWGEIFRRRGARYREPKLVLFSGAVRSACGIAGSATGPFYCPADEKLYLDLEFYDDLKNRHNAPGDFAQAYVIAHEVGHHIQNQLGTMGKVQALQRRLSEAQANQLSVRLELQADFYAGVWAHYAAKRGILDPGDVEEALNAASAIGDDRLQQQSRGYVVPDSFTHGSSAQRVAWFKRGLESGDLTQGNTFQ